MKKIDRECIKVPTAPHYFSVSFFFFCPPLCLASSPVIGKATVSLHFVGEVTAQVLPSLSFTILAKILQNDSIFFFIKKCHHFQFYCSYLFLLKTS